jgi:hypothetical protein
MIAFLGNLGAAHYRRSDDNCSSYPFFGPLLQGLAREVLVVPGLEKRRPLENARVVGR